MQWEKIPIIQSCLILKMEQISKLIQLLQDQKNFPRNKKNSKNHAKIMKLPVKYLIKLYKIKPCPQNRISQTQKPKTQPCTKFLTPSSNSLTKKVVKKGIIFFFFCFIHDFLTFKVYYPGFYSLLKGQVF